MEHPRTPSLTLLETTSDLESNSVSRSGRSDPVKDVDASTMIPESLGTLESEAILKEEKRARVILRFWIVFMVLTGGAVDYFADFFNTVVPDGGLANSAAVFLTMSMSFLACAIPPTFTQEDRASLRSVHAGNWRFKYKVMVPALADLVITGMRYIAILYVSPAIVSILKTSSQLLVLSLYKHFCGKRLTWRQATCLFVAFLGELAVSFAGSLGSVPGSSSSTAAAILGLVLAVGSGVLGAVRNVVEEALLQGDNLSAGGLLLAESWISFFGMVCATLLVRGIQGKLMAFLSEVAAVCSMGSIWPLLLALMFCTYGKDFGKLLVTKQGDALLAKVLCMQFPIVTWALSLLTFVATAGSFGEGLDPVASPVRLAGFLLVGASCMAFVVLQKKKL